LSKHAPWHDRGPCFDKLSMTTEQDVGLQKGATSLRPGCRP
jgi:hypothetical protein